MALPIQSINPKPGNELKKEREMNDERARSISDLLADSDLMSAALVRASREALLSHARAGRSVPICPNGEVIWLSPEEVLSKLATLPVAAKSAVESKH